MSKVAWEFSPKANADKPALLELLPRTVPLYPVAELSDPIEILYPSVTTEFLPIAIELNPFVSASFPIEIPFNCVVKASLPIAIPPDFSASAICPTTTLQVSGALAINPATTFLELPRDVAKLPTTTLSLLPMASHPRTTELSGPTAFLPIITGHKSDNKFSTLFSKLFNSVFKQFSLAVWQLTILHTSVTGAPPI